MSNAAAIRFRGPKKNTDQVQIGFVLKPVKLLIKNLERPKFGFVSSQRLSRGVQGRMDKRGPIVKLAPRRGLSASTAIGFVLTDYKWRTIKIGFVSSQGKRSSYRAQS
jgi:hypothetical protein